MGDAWCILRTLCVCIYNMRGKMQYIQYIWVAAFPVSLYWIYVEENDYATREAGKTANLTV
jgi:hypothetical protein